jgi:hypothetical protein
MGDRAVQIIASVVCVAALAVAGFLQPRLTNWLVFLLLQGWLPCLSMDIPLFPRQWRGLSFWRARRCMSHKMKRCDAYSPSYFF